MNHMANTDWTDCPPKIAEMVQVRRCAMVVLLTIAGCAGPMGTMHSDTPTARVTAFDGTYSNTIRVTGVAEGAQGTNWCDTPGQPVITVSDGEFSYAVPHPNAPGNMTGSFPAALAQDGSFSGQVTSGTISGHVSGSHIEGTINGQGCLYAFAGDRV